VCRERRRRKKNKTILEMFKSGRDLRTLQNGEGERREQRNSNFFSRSTLSDIYYLLN